MSKLILVAGATGNIGQEVVRQLAARGALVRAFVHSPTKAQLIQRLGVEVALGDLAQPDTVYAAMEGVEKLFLLSPMDPRMAEWESNAIQAAQRAGVCHIIHLSGTNARADSPLLFNRLHGQSDAQLMKSGLAHTILRPEALMQNVLAYAPTIIAQGVFYASQPNGRMAMVDSRDVAAVAIAALTESGHEGQAYDITGPEALSMNQVAEKLSAGLGKRVTCVEVLPDAMRKGMEAAGIPEWMASYAVGVAEYYAALADVKTTTFVADVAHKQPISFDQFVRDHVGVFKG